MKKESIYIIGLPAENPHMPFIEYIRPYIKSSDSILDIGGGNGAYSGWLKNNGFNKVTLIDKNKQYISQAKKRGIDSLIMDATKIKLKDKSFDIVLIFEVIEHISQFEKILLEAKRIAKRHIFISTPNCTDIDLLKESNLTYYHLLSVDHVNFFTHNDLFQLLKKHFNNFNVDATEPIIGFSIFKLFGMPRAIRAIIKLFIKLKLIRPLFYYRLMARIDV